MGREQTGASRVATPLDLWRLFALDGHLEQLYVDLLEEQLPLGLGDSLSDRSSLVNEEDERLILLRLVTFGGLGVRQCVAQVPAEGVQ